MPANYSTVFTTKDIINRCAKAEVSEYTSDPIISYLRPKFSSKLVGKTFDFHFGNQDISYRFDRHFLLWRENGGEWNEEYCEVLESSREGVFLVHHLRTHVNPYEAATLILDVGAELVTCIWDRLGQKSMNRDVNRTVLFGWWGEKKTALHCYNDDLVCKTIDWKFTDEATIHMSFVNVQCLAFTSPKPVSLPGWSSYFWTFNPTKYLKIAEDLYVISFYAPYQSGMEVTLLMDLRKMKALGASFGFDSTDKFTSCTFGAIGAFAQFAFIGEYAVE